MASTKQDKLTADLLHHEFDYDEEHRERYLSAKIVAEYYSKAESAISVLSNMGCDISYICYGRLGEKLGLGCRDEVEEVESIWEKKILDRVHPDDTAEKIAWELRFLAFLKDIPVSERPIYYLQHFLRIKDGDGTYHYLRHRIFYLDYDHEGNVLLALCVYTPVAQSQGSAGIVNSLSDTIVRGTERSTQGILSERERGILEHISRGKASKQIAETLCLSTNTVNNHRQNIMRKLNCQNTTEAVSVARALGLIE